MRLNDYSSIALWDQNIRLIQLWVYVNFCNLKPTLHLQKKKKLIMATDLSKNSFKISNNIYIYITSRATYLRETEFKTKINMCFISFWHFLRWPERYVPQQLTLPLVNIGVIKWRDMMHRQVLAFYLILSALVIKTTTSSRFKKGS